MLMSKKIPFDANILIHFIQADNEMNKQMLYSISRLKIQEQIIIITENFIN